LNKSLSRVLSYRAYGYVQRAAEIAFDKWAAQIVKETVPDVVIAYENTALHTFRAAKALGKKCVLDAASLHHSEQDRHLITRVSEELKAKIDLAKDEELALADLVITASELAAASYHKHSNGKNILAVPLGVDTERFSMGNLTRWQDSNSTFVFIFVGSADEKKGFDTLLSAISILRGTKLRVELWVAGHLNMEVGMRAGIKSLGMLGHRDLSDVLRQAHCLVLPSRLDSFGLVVLEAFASGIPVIVSEMVGAKQVITEGQNGFIVPVGDAISLASCMREVAENRGHAAAMGLAARSTSEQHSWSVYHQRIQNVIHRVAGTA
jgi:glycosyltransferase involved in cell wall biosynthesis